MGTVMLLRHARSTANSSGVLAGRTEGVGLDDHGREQVTAVAARLANVPLAVVVSSPLQRCLETLAGVTDVQPKVDERLAEIDYGEWTGRGLGELGKEPLWAVVQQHPSAAVFPGGEAMAAVSARAVAAVREWDRVVAEEHGPHAVWLACSHGDVIKAVLADALGLHLDGFQRIVVDPCSISVVQYTATRPFVVRVNDAAGPLVPPAPATSDAVVGGQTGTAD